MGISRRFYFNFYSLHSVTGNLGDTGNDLLRFGNGKKNLGPHAVVGYGIKIFWPGLFITSPDHLAEMLHILDINN